MKLNRTARRRAVEVSSRFQVFSSISIFPTHTKSRGVLLLISLLWGRGVGGWGSGRQGGEGRGGAVVRIQKCWTAPTGQCQKGGCCKCASTESCEHSDKRNTKEDSKKKKKEMTEAGEERSLPLLPPPDLKAHSFLFPLRCGHVGTRHTSLRLFSPQTFM